MKYIVFSVLLLQFLTLQAQEIELFYVSIQGSWDKTGNKNEARFNGDNSLIHTYFKLHGDDLLSAGEEVNEVMKIQFNISKFHRFILLEPP